MNPPKLFEQVRIGSMKLGNRLVRSATWEGMCEDDGRPTERLAALYADLARGGVGLIITGYTYVSPEGKQMPGKMGICTGGFAGEMQALADAVHESGGLICMQLVHTGGQTTGKMIGRRPLAPSALASELYPEVPEAMTRHDIDRVVGEFGEAAGRAREYGFDAVQIHGAHGYLVSQFLSPLTNRREDVYGGDLGGRARFLMEVCRSVRSSVGGDFPVLVKLNGSDHLEGGMGSDEAVEVARALDREGIAAIEVSGGTPASGSNGPVRRKIRSLEQEAYNLPEAERIKAAVACPIVTVGGFRTLSLAEEVIGQGKTDCVSLSRPLIREPDLPRKWERGESDRAECISCNGCFRPGLKEGGIYCVKKRELERGRE